MQVAEGRYRQILESLVLISNKNLKVILRRPIAAFRCFSGVLGYYSVSESNNHEYLTQREIP